MTYRPVSRSPSRALPADLRPTGELPPLADGAGWEREDRLSHMRHEAALQAWEAQRAQRAWERRRELPDGRIALDLGLVWH